MVSARCDYACKALLELALHWPSKEPLQIHLISERQHIPMRYLVHILLQLKRMGLLTSLRGRAGGYNLAKSPNKVSLGEVMRQIGGPILQITNSARENKSVFSKIWNETEDAIAKALDNITFEDISNKAKGIDKAIVYQI